VYSKTASIVSIRPYKYNRFLYTSQKRIRPGSPFNLFEYCVGKSGAVSVGNQLTDDIKFLRYSQTESFVPKDLVMNYIQITMFWMKFLPLSSGMRVEGYLPNETESYPRRPYFNACRQETLRSRLHYRTHKSHPLITSRNGWFENAFRMNKDRVLNNSGERGSIVDWGSILHAGRSRFRFSMRWLNFFFNVSNPSSRTTALRSTQPLTEMSTRNLPGR
jgi:hypothetical protein